VINDKVRDALRLDLKSYRVVGDCPSLGTIYIPLEGLVQNGLKTEWYPIDGGKGEVKISMSRAFKKVSELPIQATKGSASVSKKLIYALNLVRRKMADFGLCVTIGISMQMAVVATRISVKIEPLSAEEVEAIEKDLETAEKEVDNDQEEDTLTQAPENKNIFKRMLAGAVESLANNLKSTLKDMRLVGLSGTVGCSVILGVPMYGIQFEIAVDVDIAGNE